MACCLLAACGSELHTLGQDQRDGAESCVGATCQCMCAHLVHPELVTGCQNLPTLSTEKHALDGGGGRASRGDIWCSPCTSTPTNRSLVSPRHLEPPLPVLLLLQPRVHIPQTADLNISAMVMLRQLHRNDT